MPETQPFEYVNKPKSSDGRIQLLPPWTFLDAYDIEEVLGSVQGVSVNGLGIFREIGAKVKDVLGGRAKGIEKEYEKSHSQAVTELRDNAEKLGADTVINFTVDQELLVDPETNNMMVKAIADGVAVRLRDKKQIL